MVGRSSEEISMRRRGHASERGFWWLLGAHTAEAVSWALLGLGSLAVAAGVVVLGVGYLAVQYDHTAHGGGPLGGPPPAAPVDTTTGGTIPCQGTEIDTYVSETLHLRMTGKGFRTTTSDPQLVEPDRDTFGPLDDPDADARYRGAVTAWKARMQGIVGDADNKLKTKCQELEQANRPAKPPESAPPATVKEIAGTYTVDNTTVQAIGGCGDSAAQAKGAPSALTVVEATRPDINVSLAGGGTPVTLSGPNFDVSGDHVDYTKDIGQGVTASLNGNFYLSSGRWQFNGEYATLAGGGGCGYKFIAVRS